MKKRINPSAKAHLQSAFFTLRVLIGLFIVLAGVFLGLLGFGVFSPASTAQAQQKYKIITNSKDPLVPNGFDCSKIHELGIDKQMNFRAGAIMIACGQAQGGGTSATLPASPLGALTQFIKKLFSPLAYGGTDVDLITGTETYPNVTQSETFSAINPDNPLQIVIAYNDSRGRNFNPINISGASCSTDGGITFTRITGTNGQSPFSGTAGDPVILYKRNNSTWYTVWIDLACGSQGLGGYKSTTPWDPNSWTHYCVHTGSNDDRESGWADNNPSSPHYGRMYVSWNDFARGQAIFVRYSDDGVTWTETGPLPGTGSNPFIRNVQITGDLATGDVYIAAMNENGGGTNFNRNNLIYRSTDGGTGTTFTNTYTGPTFFGPGRATNSIFACMYGSGTSGYWRHMGWGEPAAYNHVVHYVYAQCGQNVTCSSATDHGDVYYIRSTDSGVTFGTPVKLNTDTGTAAQWEPNLSVSPSGTVFAVWYDERTGGACTAGSNTPCYQMFARKSNDNGLTWMPDMPFSDVVSPLPEQPDPGIQAPYVGDYDYQIGIATSHRTGWVDGRNAINNVYQQDAFTDRELVGCSVTSPACGSLVTGTAPTDFILNVTEPVDPATVHANALMVNGTPANAVTVINGNTTIVFHFNTSPVTQGLNTMHIPAGAFNCAQGPVLEFTCTFRYGQVQLMVTSTNPPVGGTFTPPPPGTYTYDVNFNIAFDPNSVQTSDLTLTGNVGATVTNVQPVNGNMTARFTLNIQYGGSLTANIAAGAITDQFGNPCAAFSGNYTVQTTVLSAFSRKVHGVGGPCQFRVLIAYADIGGQPTMLQNEIQAEPGVTVVDLFDAFNGTPTLAQLQQYDIVFAFSNNFWNNAVAMGDVLADYEDGGGIVVVGTFAWDSRGGWNLAGRWMTGGYTPYNSAAQTNFSNNCANITNPGHPLMQGVATLCAFYRNGVTLTAGAASVADWTDGLPAVAYKANNGHTAVGINAYLGYLDQFSGEWGRVVVNAGRWLHASCAPTFDIPLPLTGNVGIECRTGPTYQMIIDFANPVTVGSAAVTSGTGNVTNFSGNGTPQITVNLDSVTDVQRITVTLMNVTDGISDVPATDVPVSMGVLIGDTTGNGIVNAGDVAQTKSQVGNPVTSSNFREDVNANGLINSVDVALVKSKVGTALPP